jgi:hypothetical protein
MRNILKIAVIVIIAVLLSTSTYVLFFTDVVNNGEVDDEAPTIDTITVNATGTTGKITTISVTFSDNVEVTEAILYYKTASASDWDSTSILNRSVDLSIPSDSDEDWFYYVTIDDAAGNGPVGDPSTDGSSYYTITVTNPVKDLEHFVFIEEGTATWCNNCPLVSDMLHELYVAGNNNFYYVSMIEDYKTLAKRRLEQDYNIYGYPTVYIDGGIDVIVGTDYDISILEEKISTAEDRNVAAISLNLSAEIDGSNNIVETEVTVENYERQSYEGILKIYLTERISIANYGGDPYHFGFLDFIADEDIIIESGGQKKVIKTYDVSNLDADNLMIIAVVFNSESETKYSNPDGNEKPFDAYYADAADETLVVSGGNLPPAVGITSPQLGMFYKNGNLCLTKVLDLFQMSHFNQTKLFGMKKMFSVQAEDDSGIDKVEFYIDGELIVTIEEEPYEYTYSKFLRTIFMKQHTFEVIAYDDDGKTSTASIEFKARL